MSSAPTSPPHSSKSPLVVLCEICSSEIVGVLIGVRRGGFSADCCLDCGIEIGKMCAEGIVLSDHPRDAIIKMARARMAWPTITDKLLADRHPLWEALATV